MTASTSIASSSSVTASHYKRVYSRGQSLVRSFMWLPSRLWRHSRHVYPHRNILQCYNHPSRSCGSPQMAHKLTPLLRPWTPPSPLQMHYLPGDPSNEVSELQGLKGSISARHRLFAWDHRVALGKRAAYSGDPVFLALDIGWLLGTDVTKRQLIQ